MIEWKDYKLSELGLLQRGRSRHRPRYAFHLYGGDYPFIQTGEIREARKHITSYEKTYSEAGLEQSKLWPKGTLCITIAANIAELAILSFDSCFPDSVLGFIPNNEIVDLDFIYYILTHFQRELKHVGEGSVQDNINMGTFQDIQFPIPPLPEQKAIASVLSSLDDKIDLLHRQNKILESMAETLFRQWFVVEAQEEWEWVELGQFIEVMRGLSYKGAGLAEKGNGLPMHNLNSVYEGGGYKFEGIKYYSGEYKERHLVKPGDVIITNTEQGHDLLLIGYPAIVPKYFGDLGIFSQHIYRLRLTDKRLTEPFLYYLLMSYDVREQIAGATNGSTVNMLSKDGVEWVRLKKPPDEKIEMFTAIVKPFLEKKESNYPQIRALEKLRDTLLPRLMSGEVRVSV